MTVSDRPSLEEQSKCSAQADKLFAGQNYDLQLWPTTRVITLPTCTDAFSIFGHTFQMNL
ncbi:hypothetical protein BDD14_0167 [Edaphobacter modestus]|uniref:Uncharacterized protein n=1 Tax=Edaphobacter modestus TaxID=388466 RepID=A0A4Q7YNA8_9BACT|nr:hypothetical protein BDD14_0167 [Edaphobacter modestus]